MEHFDVVEVADNIVFAALIIACRHGTRKQGAAHPRMVNTLTLPPAVSSRCHLRVAGARGDDIPSHKVFRTHRRTHALMHSQTDRTECSMPPAPFFNDGGGIKRRKRHDSRKI